MYSGTGQCLCTFHACVIDIVIVGCRYLLFSSHSRTKQVQSKYINANIKRHERKMLKTYIEMQRIKRADHNINNACILKQNKAQRMKKKKVKKSNEIKLTNEYKKTAPSIDTETLAYEVVTCIEFQMSTDSNNSVCV